MNLKTARRIRDQLRRAGILCEIKDDSGRDFYQFEEVPIPAEEAAQASGSGVGAG